MAITIQQSKLYPVRRDKQVAGVNVFVSGGGGGGTVEGSAITEYGFLDGTAAAPSIFYRNSTNTGFFLVTGYTIGVACAGFEEFRFTPDGDFHADGDVIGFSTTISDRRLKEDIFPIKNGLATVEKLVGVKYKLKKDGSEHYGLIAQDVENILPEIIKEHKIIGDDENEYKTIRYIEIIPYLIESIKELKKKIHDLEYEINYIKNYNT